jgi:hypothetical protein
LQKEERVATRRTLLSIIAVSLTILAIASAGLFWLRLAGPREDEAGEETAGSPESPVAELATAVGFDEEDCGLDTLYAATGGITGNAEGKSPIEQPRAPFSLKFKDEVSPYSLMSTFVLPGEQVEVEAVFTAQRTQLEAQVEAGELVTLAPDRWRWKAPQEPGVHCLSVREKGSPRSTPASTCS